MAKKQIDYASMFTLRKDGRYCATYTENGKQKFVYDRDPERLWHKMNDPKQEHITTFREVAEAWEKEHREEVETRTWNNYKPHYEAILAEHGDTPFSEIEPSDIVADLARAKAKGWSATVVVSRRCIWRMIFDHAVVQGEIKYNPVSSIKLPKGLKRGKRTGPTREQTDIILNNVDAPFGLFPFLLLCTGLRRSEALALQWDDIDFDLMEIHITKSIDYTNEAKPVYKSPKTEAGYRVVPIVDILLEPLKTAHSCSSSIYVFPCPPSYRGGPGGGLMTEGSYSGLWRRYCEAVGLVDDNGKPTLTAHQLRHGTATLMFEMDVDEITAQHIMGHSRIEITRGIYTDLRSEQKRKSVDKFNKGLSDILSKSSN